jgi:PAS domain S-box-containing protein
MTTKIKSLSTLIIAEIVLIVVLVALTIYVLTLQNKAYEQLDKAIQLRHTSYHLADQLRQSSDDLTRMVRTYAATADSRFEAYFQAILDIRAGETPRPENYDRIFWDFIIAEEADIDDFDGERISLKELMDQVGITDSEFQQLSEAERRSNELVNMEREAMFAMKGIFKDTQGNFTRSGKPDQQLAIDLLFGREYHLAKKNIMTPINDFLAAVETRTQKNLTKAQNKIQSLSTRSTYLYCLLVGFVPILVYTIRKHQKITESGLRESEEKFRLLLNSTAEAIYGLDTKGNCIFCNPACLEILGYEREDHLIGKNMHDLIHHHRIDGAEYLVEECKTYLAFRNGEGVHVDNEVLWRADGSPFDAEYTSHPMRKGKEVVGSVVAFHNITERKKAQNALVEAKKSAENANQAKGEFLAKISHEIRTPMTVFMSATEHLLDIDKDPEHREVLELAELSSQRLYTLIEAVLDFSKIEVQKLELYEEKFDLRKCLQNPLKMMQPKANKKNISLELEVSPDVPKNIVGDEYRLGQILLNLIGNAIKFTEEGEVKISVNLLDNNLVFNVSDTGTGIPEEKLESIFEDFIQADNSITRKYGGAGLGLAISRGLVELMGGRINVQSQLGQGSTFTFNLPMKT